MEYELKTGPQGHVYIPKKIRQILGNPLKVLPDATAAVVFSANTPYAEVLKSLIVIQADLRHRVELTETRTK